MSLLKLPRRAPEYRNGRDHSEFIVRLKDVIPSRDALVEDLCTCLERQGFDVVEGSMADADEAMAKNTLIGSRLVPVEEYGAP